MNDYLNSYQIVQNEALGAHAIWEYCRYYNDYSDENNYSPLLLSFSVLPIVYNKRAREEIYLRRFKEGSLHITINENRDIYSGLQERMESMSSLTFSSINNAVKAELIQYDKKSSKIIPIRKTSIMKDVKVSTSSDYYKIIQASRRIGAWYAQLNLVEIMNYFNIRF